MKVTSDEASGFITFEQVIFHEQDVMADTNERKVKLISEITMPARYIQAISVAHQDLNRIADAAGIKLLNSMPDVTILTLMNNQQIYSFVPARAFAEAIGSVILPPGKQSPAVLVKD